MLEDNDKRSFTTACLVYSYRWPNYSNTSSFMASSECVCDEEVKILNKQKQRQDLKWGLEIVFSGVWNIAGIRIVLPWQPSHFPVTPARPAGKVVVVVVVVWGHPELGGNRRVLWRCYNSEAVSGQTGSPGLFSAEKERLSWGNQVKLHVGDMEIQSGGLNYTSDTRDLMFFFYSTRKTNPDTNNTGMKNMIKINHIRKFSMIRCELSLSWSHHPSV